MQTCSFTGIHLDDKIQKQKKSEMFFCILSSTDDKTIAKGVLQSCKDGQTTKHKKTKVSTWGRNWRRNETLNLMQLGEIDVIGSACDIDHDISRRSGRNSANCRSGR